MAKNKSIKKAVEAIDSGDARGLRKHINEALVDKVKKALDKKEKQLAKNLIESATKVSLQEADVLKGSTTSVKFGKTVKCVVVHDTDDYSDFGITAKSGTKKGSTFTASSTQDVMSKLKCTKHQIQTDQKKLLEGGATTAYVFVDPFHATNDEERVVQIFVDKQKAQEWYEESVNVGSEPTGGDGGVGEPIFR
jgi:hypothetical protein